MSKFKSYAKWFLDSYYYPLLVFITALLTHTFSIEPFGIAVLALSAGLGFLLCEDLRFFISPLIMFILMFSQESVASGIFYKTPYLIAIVCFAIYLFALFIAYIVINRKKLDLSIIKKSKLFLSTAILCGAFLLNGFFNFDEYVFGNVVFALVMVISLGAIFFLFRISIKKDASTKNYLMYVLYLISMLVTLQLFISFAGQIRFVDGGIEKESILLGWGMWNNVGGMLSLLLPVHFYFATTSKRFGYLFYGTGLLSYLAIVLSLSRSSLLVSTFIIVVCALVSCFAGENKKVNRIITAGIAFVGVLGIIVLWDKISGILSDYLSRGFDDNGRFDIYKRGWYNFLDNPVFGGGFHSVVAQEHEFIPFLPDRCHNTVIQLLSTCGIVGLLAYAFHRFQTITLFIKKRSIFTLFCALCVASLLFTSLLDNHLFNIYPGFVYSIILAVVDKCEDDYIKQ